MQNNFPTIKWNEYPKPTYNQAQKPSCFQQILQPNIPSPKITTCNLTQDPSCDQGVRKPSLAEVFISAFTITLSHDGASALILSAKYTLHLVFGYTTWQSGDSLHSFKLLLWVNNKKPGKGLRHFTVASWTLYKYILSRQMLPRLSKKREKLFSKMRPRYYSFIIPREPKTVKIYAIQKVQCPTIHNLQKDLS